IEREFAGRGDQQMQVLGSLVEIWMLLKQQTIWPAMGLFDHHPEQDVAVEPPVVDTTDQQIRILDMTTTTSANPRATPPPE
ncbi:unnamed protein product, partial [Amoebophrya sp. A25]